MSLQSSLALVGVGILLYFFPSFLTFGLRVGPFTHGGQSIDTRGVAFRFVGVILVVVGVAKLLGL
ncbi:MULTISPECIES: hypothetical protein [Haloferax]|uniref:DUF4345 domain-containing protein n=1 Tax=Haloferax marinum TaxID=2666143 RepID=A0A6A8G891_9EURY|nr:MULTISPECIES: hypothetical protein [Haloferax]KAB1197286.1 hypothetical protein Hfx1150_07075 [Haloferax sp. CBA1150]MRW96326.1 hypothetical protein [Haloferax marinum]